MLVTWAEETVGMSQGAQASPRAHRLSLCPLGLAFVQEIRDGRENRSPRCLNGAEANAVDP